MTGLFTYVVCICRHAGSKRLHT